MFVYAFALLFSLFFAYLYTLVRDGAAPALRGPRCGTILTRFSMRHTAQALVFALSAAPLILLSGLRYGIGVDYFYTYVPLYEQIAAGLPMDRVHTEPAFYLLVKLVCLLGGGTVWMFLLAAALTVGLFWLGFSQLSDNFCLSVILFVAAESYFVSLMYVRQMLAAAILFYGMRFVREQDFLRYAGFVVLAFLFHKSAILFLPLYLFAVIPIHPALLAGGVAVLSFLHDPLKRLLNWIVLQTPYADYVGSVYAAGYRFFYAKFYQYVLLFLAAALLYRQEKNNRLYRYCMGLLAILIYLNCNFDIMPQTDRLSWYLEIGNLLLVPMAVARCRWKWLRPVLAVGLIAVFAMVTIDNVFVYHAHGVVPYRFVFAPDAVIW